MLCQLNIQNFALIDRLSLDFEYGFNALTGETGAGKSILIDAINAALGSRVGADLIRTGADRALVEAVFSVGETAPPPLAEWVEDGLVILSREIAGSRSTCRINGRMCTASVVREIATHLIDIHGQHDHQSLLQAERHVDVLDGWAGGEVLTLKARALAVFTELREVHTHLRALQTDERERAQRVDLYQFQVDEIDSADLRPDEEDELLAERVRLANAERLYAAAGSALGSLSQADVTAEDLLGQAVRDVETAAALDPQLNPVLESLNAALIAAQDAVAELRDYQENIEFNPERLEEIQTRLETLRVLKRKYGDSVEEILAYRDKIAAELDTLTHSEERLAELGKRTAALEQQLDEVAASLHGARRAAAARFERDLGGQLADLNMARTQFSVALETPRRASESWERGLTAILGRAEFMISANPGEPLRPLARIASGGELSRVMLALKGAMAGAGAVPTLIFDEIDTGVGGRTAEVLGAKIAQLAHLDGGSTQILCVTHLPQIASMAGTQYQVSKEQLPNRTLVAVRRLEGDERVGELARMLGGSEATAAQHAREMLAAAAHARASRQPARSADAA